MKTLDDIITFLDEGLLEPDTFTPEMEVEFYEHNVLQLSNFFLKDLERLREFTESYKKFKLLRLS